MKTFRVASLVAIGAVAGAIACIVPKTGVAPFHLESTDFPFPSGLRLVFQEDHTQPTVTVVTVVGNGSADDPAGKEGLAHLVEHLAFRAKSGDGSILSRRLEAVGASYNGYTSLDDTSYFTAAPKDALPELLQIEATRLSDPLAGVDASALELERSIVHDELDQTFTGETVVPLLEERAFPAGHRYHRPPETQASLAAITLDDVKKFAAEAYRPSNATIVIAGDFDRAQAGSWISHAFPRAMVAGDAAGREISLAKPTPRIGSAPPLPAPPDGSVTHVQGPVSSPTVFLAWSLPGGFRPDEALVRTVVDGLDGAVRTYLYPSYGAKGGRASRGWSRERIRDVGCFPEIERDASFAICRIVPATGENPEKVARDAVDGVSTLWTLNAAGWQQRVFWEAKGDYIQNMFADSAVRERTLGTARYIHYTGRADRFRESFDDIDRVTDAATRSFASKWLTRDRVVKVVVDPISGSSEGGAAELADSHAAEPGAEPAADWFAALTPAKIESVSRAPDLQGMQDLTLANGLRLVVVRDAAAPFVEVGLFTHGGVADAKPWGLPDFAFPTFDTKDPLTLASAWSEEHFWDGDLTSIEAPSANLPAALKLLYDRVRTTKSAWNGDEYVRVLDAVDRSIAADRQLGEQRAEEAFWRTLVPGHPLGRRTFAVDELRSVGKNDLVEWLDGTLAPKNATLLVVGDLDPSKAEDAAIAIWGGWRSGNPGQRRAPLPPPPPAPARGVLLTDATIDPVKLVVGCSLGPATSSRAVTREVAVELLQQTLFDDLRQSSGATYSVSVQAPEFSGGSSLLVVQARVRGAQAQRSAKQVLAKIDEMSKGTIAPGDLGRAKWALARGTQLENQSAAELVSTLVDKVRLDRPLDDLSLRPRWIAHVTPKDIAAEISPCVGHEVVSFAGPSKSLESDPVALGAPVTRVP